VDTQDVLDAFIGSASALPFLSHSEERRGLDACGSVFYCPTGRFVLKFIGEAEFQWLLDLLPSYYNHFHEMHEQNIVRFTSQYANFSIFSIITTYRCSVLSSEDFFAKDLLHLSHPLQRQAAIRLCDKQCKPGFSSFLFIRLICSKIFWSVDAMDAKFCIKGARLSSCFHQFF
jgi:hypothetical protein